MSLQSPGVCKAHLANCTTWSSNELPLLAIKPYNVSFLMSVLLLVGFFCIISLHLLIFLYKNVSPLCKIIGACNIFNITSNVLSLYCRNSSMTKDSTVPSVNVKLTCLVQSRQRHDTFFFLLIDIKATDYRTAGGVQEKWVLLAHCLWQAKRPGWDAD